MKKILLSLLFFSFCSNAIDENQIQFKIDSCKSIANKDERLNCYDALSNVETITIPTEGIGNWTIFKDKSPVDDSVSIYLNLDANDYIDVKYKKFKPNLTIRCRENATSIFVNYGIFLGDKSIKPVTRLDSEKAVSDVYWGTSTDHQAIFYDSLLGEGEASIKFIKQLLDKNKFFIRVIPYNEKPVDATFDLSGLDEAIKPLRSVCGW